MNIPSSSPQGISQSRGNSFPQNYVFPDSVSQKSSLTGMGNQSSGWKILEAVTIKRTFVLRGELHGKTLARCHHCVKL